MDPTDFADLTGATYTFQRNGFASFSRPSRRAKAEHAPKAAGGKPISMNRAWGEARLKAVARPPA